MSTKKPTIVNIGIRLRDERMRLGLTQSDAAKAADVGFSTYQTWEKDRSPNAEALARLHSVGFDILYVVTGIKDESTLSNEDSSLLARLNQLDDKARRAWLASAAAFVESYTSSDLL
ncbi:hypothetical protein BI347_20695 [Chromobacterium sphagni]|uniref:HTH cro/C1-type domain-containing protein n=2 Tax=Chromobacterium sphagni TaxID=1903179 RepID=A0A1S1WTL2_9NEIS|nr:hypothetical protein BI347_20695 [Chromobacterium sphagni]